MKKHFWTFVLITISSLAFAQKNFIDQPFIETTSSADSLVVPNKIYISINLNEADSKNRKSVEEQERQLESILKKLNIDIEKNLSLLDLSSNFKNYFLKGQNVLKSKIYSLLVGNAVTAGKVLAELENVGISNVNIVKTEYSKADELILELKSKAVAKSKLTAEKLAKPLNQKVGKALFISDINTFSPMYEMQPMGIQMKAMASMADSQVADPINTEFQKLKFEVRVNVKYALE